MHESYKHFFSGVLPKFSHEIFINFFCSELNTEFAGLGAQTVIADCLLHFLHQHVSVQCFSVPTCPLHTLTMEAHEYLDHCRRYTWREWKNDTAKNSQARLWINTPHTWLQGSRGLVRTPLWSQNSSSYLRWLLTWRICGRFKALRLQIGSMPWILVSWKSHTNKLQKKEPKEGEERPEVVPSTRAQPQQCSPISTDKCKSLSLEEFPKERSGSLC